MNNFQDSSIEQRTLMVLAQAKNSTINLTEKIVALFNSYQWEEIVFGLKTALIIISLILGFLIFVLLIKINIVSRIKGAFSPSKPVVVFNKKKIYKKWAKIEKRLKTGTEANYKLAVLEADKIFDDILKNIGYEAEIKISNMVEIKQAGKVKNKIIEDNSFILSETEAGNIVTAYKKGLEDLGVL